MYEGQDIVDVAMAKEGQRYVLGAKVHLPNANWSGPWDCAEFVSWACYHAYKIVLAVRPPNIQIGESYSGWWHDDTAGKDGAITVAKAISTPGAILIRKPGYAGLKIGHVAISRGDNSTIEAHSSRIGVAVIPGAKNRDWSGGFLIPGVSYSTSAGPAHRPSPPRKLLRLTNPYTRGEAVRALQLALQAAGVDPGPVDGIFGNATAIAVAAYQASEGLVVDGVVGPETKAALGL